MASSVALEAAIQALTKNVYLVHGPEYDYQIYLLFGCLATSAILNVGALVVRWYCGRFWVFRLQQTRTGNWIIPNSVVCWLCLSILFITLLFKLLQTMLLYGTPGANLHDIMLWRCIPWIPLWLAGWVMAWSTSLTPLRNNISTSKRSAITTFAGYAHLANFSFFLLPILSILAVSWLSVEANSSYNTFFDNYQQILKQVSLGPEADPVALAELLQHTVIIGEAATTSVQNVWISWTVLNVVLLIIFSAVSWIQCTAFRASIQKLQKNSLSATSSERAQPLSALVWAYRTLLFSSIMFVGMNAVYLGVCLVLLIKLDEVSKGDRIAEIVVLLSVYIYAAMGTLTNVIIFVRSFVPPSTATTLSSSPQDIKNSLPQRLNEVVIKGGRRGETTTVFELEMPSSGEYPPHKSSEETLFSHPFSNGEGRYWRGL